MASRTEATRLLLTFAGRKSAWCSSLVASRQCAALWACDADPAAPIDPSLATFVPVPRVSERSAYVARLLELCASERIDAVAPLNDLDLDSLSDAKSRFESLGTRVLTGDRALIDVLADKLSAASHLARLGIPTVPTLPAEECDTALSLWGLPLVAKSRRGQGSSGLLRIDHSDQLLDLVPGTVIQPWLAGQEYHLDVLRSSQGRVVAVVVKRKLAMHQGSTDRAESVLDPSLQSLGVRLGESLSSMVGSTDVDVLATPEGPAVLDVNPRLGGGFPFTALCCPAYVDAFLRVARGEEPPSLAAAHIRTGVRMARSWQYFELKGRI